MKCPKCEHELLLVGKFIVKWGVSRIEPTADNETYTCVNVDCDNYHKALIYKV
jgi:hypothetical protein